MVNCLGLFTKPSILDVNFSRMLMIVEAGSEMALFYYYPTFDICYISGIGKAILKVVISYNQNRPTK